MILVQRINIFLILTLVETKKPRDENLHSVWRLQCDLGIITDAECPVDGGWTPWSAWSPCTGPCDDVGHRRRVRQCNNPAPSEDGISCTGPDHQIEPCFIHNCTVDDYRKLVEGDTMRLEALHQLKAVPSIMERCLQMQCPLEAIEASLVNDNTWQINPESLYNAFECVKHNIGCPVVGEWGTWSEWSACGARCGYGVRWRMRKCDSPPPSRSHLYCSGTPLQVGECLGDQCADFKRDAGGKWNDWGEWSACSENCSAGIRRRKRTCLETQTHRLFDSWGTHCRGQHDQLEVCEPKECKLNGGWSGWGAWGQCSQSCGAGRRSRSRSCTRPEPAGSGASCVGPRIDVSSCHQGPCNSFSHHVAIFNGESALHYDFLNKRSTLFHLYVRFLPLSHHGILVRRNGEQNSLARLSLHKWHICLDTSGQSSTCAISRICSPAIEPAKWHTVLVFVTSEASAMRIDDKPVSIKNTFACDPDLPNEKVNIVVGEKLHGEIQDLILNFIPLSLKISDKDTQPYYYPSKVSNVRYDKAGQEVGHLELENENYMRLPCPNDQDEWQIKMTIKPKTDTCTLLFLKGWGSQSWIHLYLHNMRLKLRMAVGHFRTESISYSEFQTDQWLDLVMSKPKDAKTIEVTINVVDRMHVVFEDLENVLRNRRTHENFSKLCTIGQEPRVMLCSDEYFVAGVPQEVKTTITLEDTDSFEGVIASISVNDEYLNLYEYNIERYKGDNTIQVSSRTASVSGSYHETAWDESNSLNLTCLHARSIRSPNTAHWMFLDTIISDAFKVKKVRSIDDGKVLRLVATANNDLKGFYTCRAHSNKRTKNVVTYGVVGQAKYKLSGPDLTTAIAVITTLALCLVTLGCLFVEGIHDIRNGYGFFRDAHWLPEEEAEAVCKYIDQNKDSIGCTHAADAAKFKARLIGREIAGHLSFNNDERASLMNVNNIGPGTDEYITPGGLSTLREIKSSILEKTHEILRCENEDGYISSPCHGSISSPRTKPSSMSSVEPISPRVLCSRLLLSRRHLGSIGIRNNRTSIPRQIKSRLIAIKSSTNINKSSAKILQKFQELKSYDT